MPAALPPLFEHGALFYLYDLSGPDDINRYRNISAAASSARGVRFP